MFTETGKMKKYPAPKKWKPQDTTVTSTVKAAGLLSLNISLSDKGTKKIYREIPPQRSTHTITYIHTTLHQVICAAILSLSTLLSLCVMCQKRFPRLPWILFFLSIAFLFPYNPQYIAYLNSWAYGIFLAIGFRFIFVVWKKLFTLKNNAVICLFLILFSSSAFAQERKMQTMSTVPTSIVPTTISTYVTYYPNSPEITDKTIYIPWEQFTKYNLTRTPIEKSISFFDVGFMSSKTLPANSWSCELLSTLFPISNILITPSTIISEFTLGKIFINCLIRKSPSSFDLSEEINISLSISSAVSGNFIMLIVACA